MPLPLPNLDSRRWADLLDEGRASIPRYAPEWTDHNAHDPGMTLIELLAWLTEMDVYRTNQVPERHVRKFVSLVGFPPLPPQAAKVVLTYRGAGSMTAGSEVATSDGVRFRLLRDLTISPTSLTALQVDAGDGTIHNYTDEWREHLPVACLGHNPTPGAAMYLGFSPVPGGVPLALYIWLREPGGGGARLAWEGSTSGPQQWTTLTPTYDDTRALTLDGTVELILPASTTPVVLGEVAAPLFYLRCRLVEGAYDATPLLGNIAPHSVVVEQAVAARQTFIIVAGVAPTGTPPNPGDQIRFDTAFDADGTIQALAFLPPNAPDHPDIRVVDYQAPTIATAGRITLELVRMAATRVLPDAPVQRDSVHVYTQQNGDWQEWIRRDDLDASRRTDFHFTLDATTGTLAFGDGERGRVIPAGAVLLVNYRMTLADVGNISAGAEMQPQWPGLTVRNLAPAVGGVPQEDLQGAASRAVSVLYAHDPRSRHTPTRAVTLEDFERLALSVPGRRVARAKAYANVHGDYPCLRAPGIVTVVVIADLDVPQPIPSAGLLHDVWCYLDRRRMVCTQVRVTGPQYLEVRVHARVKLLEGADRTRVRDDIRRTLDRFLDAHLGGPHGDGWPFGRDVYRSEILQRIDGVPGVDHVLSFTLTAGDSEERCGNLTVCPTWLVTPGPHQIDVITRER